MIDVLQRVKPAGKAGQNSYEATIDAMSALQRWATEQRVAVVCLHHTRKGGADDPLEALSGSNGLSPAPTLPCSLTGMALVSRFYVRGRDVEEKESAMRFVAGMWNVTGRSIRCSPFQRAR